MSKNFTHLSCTLRDAVPLIICALKANQPAMLWGSYGIGKTDIANQIAKAMGFDSAIVICPSIEDIIDFKLPYLKDGDDGTKESSYAMSDRLPKSGRHLIIIDEINTASMDLQPALYSLVLARRLGNYVLPEECRIIATGNRESDRAAAQPMSTALKNRFGLHLNIIPDKDSWCQWAIRNDVAPELIAFVREYPSVLEGANPDDPCGGCTPRGLAKLSSMIKVGVPQDHETLVYQGSIGMAEGARLGGFMALCRKGIRVEEVLADPKKARVPEESHENFAIISALTSAANKDNLEKILTYGDRMAKSYAVVLMGDIKRRGDGLDKTATFAKAIVKYQGILTDVA